MRVVIVTSLPQTYQYDGGARKLRPDGLFRSVAGLANAIEKSGNQVEIYFMKEKGILIPETSIGRTSHLNQETRVEELLSSDLDSLILSLKKDETASILSILADNRVYAKRISRLFVVAGPKAKTRLRAELGVTGPNVVYLDRPGVTRITRKASQSILAELGKLG